MRIAVGICTFKRQKELVKCLLSLNDMERPQGLLYLSLIVVDNDPNGIAKTVIDSLTGQITLPVYYEVEKKRGIPFARNKILKIAADLDIDWLAFVDDDEWVDRFWLSTYWKYIRISCADVFAGPVQTSYPANAPQWIIDGRFFQYNDFADGEIKNKAYTNNVIFDFNKIVRKWNLSFDESFGLRGGSDLKYFGQVHSKGGIIRWVRGAVVIEKIDMKRMSVSYILKRKWRVNNNEYQFSKLPIKKKFKKRFVYLIKASFGFWKGCIIFPFKLFGDKSKYIRNLEKIVGSIAVFCACLGFYIHWNEYEDNTME
jgi:GT2 family glycosyltransferase